MGKDLIESYTAAAQVARGGRRTERSCMDGGKSEDAIRIPTRSQRLLLQLCAGWVSCVHINVTSAPNRPPPTRAMDLQRQEYPQMLVRDICAGFTYSL